VAQSPTSCPSTVTTTLREPDGGGGAEIVGSAIPSTRRTTFRSEEPPFKVTRCFAGVSVPSKSIVPENVGLPLRRTVGRPGRSKSPVTTAPPFIVTLSGSITCIEPSTRPFMDGACLTSAVPSAVNSDAEREIGRHRMDAASSRPHLERRDKRGRCFTFAVKRQKGSMLYLCSDQRRDPFIRTNGVPWTSRSPVTTASPLNVTDSGSICWIEPSTVPFRFGPCLTKAVSEIAPA